VIFPLAIESFRLDRYALVISSSHCVALGALAPPTALHVAYVHSTLRYVREAQATQTVKAPVRARLVVPVQMVPGLIAALQDNFRLYQESFGPPKGQVN